MSDLLVSILCFALIALVGLGLKAFFVWFGLTGKIAGVIAFALSFVLVLGTLAFLSLWSDRRKP